MSFKQHPTDPDKVTYVKAEYATHKELSEPIAWMHTNSKQIFKTEKPNEFDLHLFTPLYTHPMRELTEEEILEVWKENYGDVNISNFARAILKKASEK